MKTHGAEGVTLVGGRCLACSGPVITVITQISPYRWLRDIDGAVPEIPFTNRYGIEFKRTIWHAQVCRICMSRQGYVVKVAGKPKEKPDARQEIVDAIRRLKKSGWRFPWEAKDGPARTGSAEGSGGLPGHPGDPQKAEAAP